MRDESCPECGKMLTGKENRCTCGWIKLEIKSHPQSDYRCQHRNFGEYCASLGTICSSPYGSGPWYCKEHWQKI